MKTRASFLIVSMFACLTLSAQIGINSTGNQPDSTAGVDVFFNDRGFLQPRLRGYQILAIPDPATGLMVFNLDGNKPVYFDGISWKNFDGTSTWFNCGEVLEIIHITGSVAPVSKTVTYGTVTGLPGEPDKCWITRNLGAERQPTGSHDNTEASAGWYWQFNSRKGYKYDGNTRFPGTEWIDGISENSDWNRSEDPCAIELGNEWRIPSETEWINLYSAVNGFWFDWWDSWNVELKMHAAGYLVSESGTLNARGSEGYYWSSSQYSNLSGNYLKLGANGFCGIINDNKSAGRSLRCVKCASQIPPAPTAGNNTTSSNWIIWAWNPVAGADGYKWNTSDDFASALDMGDNTSKTETGLGGGASYDRYIWAYDGCSPSKATMLVAATDPATPGCGDTLRIHHIAGSVAPTDKIVDYLTVSGIPGEPYKCWISSNLGASHEALAINDSTEASAGWYWQFNRKQGYKYDGTVRTPNIAWSSSGGNSDWAVERDPCRIELGNYWHIPTGSEWNNVKNGGNWTNWNGPWNTALKMSAAGYIYDQTVSGRGIQGIYWSSNQLDINSGSSLLFSNDFCYISSYNKNYGLTLRCVKCLIPPPVAPSEGTHVSYTNQIIWNWTAVSGATGYKWNTTDNYETAEDLGTATNKTESGLDYGTSFTRFVWSYNECDVPSDPVILNASTLPFNFICGSDSLTINHVAGAIAPVSKSVTYGTVTNVSGDTTRCWITANLGADHQAIAVDDSTEASGGWYWKFNRKQGYKHDGTVRIPDVSWQYISENSDWMPADDPCVLELGNGWRIPTQSEWITMVSAGGWTNWNGPWNSVLKLHAAGYLNENLNERGSSGNYWSNSQFNDYMGKRLNFNSDICNAADNWFKTDGLSVRCVKCIANSIEPPLESTHMVSSNWITWRWDPVGGASGYKWNSSNDWNSAVDVGNNLIFTEMGLSPETTYTRYAWAYNECSQSIAIMLTAVTDTITPGCGGLLVINHTAGLIAPVNKTVQYQTVSDVPGEPDKCWITSNLGAEHQATAVNDATEASAGWYWQFNRKQGYLHDGTGRTPNTSWNYTFMDLDWTQDNDPCGIEICTDWRIPTSTEWNNVQVAGNWSDWNGPWESPLKIHASGSIYDNLLTDRGSSGNYWSSSSTSYYESERFYFNMNYLLINPGWKSYGNSIRCLNPSFSPLGSSPEEGIHEPSTSQVIWKWTSVPGAAGYKWNTVNDYETALNLQQDTMKAENGLTYGTAYTRYVWAHTACDEPSDPVTLNASTLPFSFSCGSDSLAINHIAGDVAPVSITVHYGTVTNIYGDTTRCWITSNLGADHQASAVDDDTVTSAGWYWQFNRKQGFKHDGITIIPNVSWQFIDENSEWADENDPCVLELGNGWRIPTISEWMGVVDGGSWTSWDGPWNSALKVHAAGFTDSYYLYDRGSQGHYWSGSQFNTYNGQKLDFSAGYCEAPVQTYKFYGLPLRCVKCISNTVANPAEATHDISFNWIGWKWEPVSGASGYKWSTSDDYDNAVDLGARREFAETGLIPGTSYSCYVWVYNKCGYSVATMLTATTDTISPGCGDTLTVNHIVGDVAPVNKTVQYYTVSDLPGEPDKCWITSNLGADHQATAVDDDTEPSAGWYWQFNRKQGYKHDGISRTPDIPWNNTYENSNWINANDPCRLELGGEWRIPTDVEWFNVDAAGNWTDWEDPWYSPLKIHASGYLVDSWINNRGTDGIRWSSSESGYYHGIIFYTSVGSSNTSPGADKNYGYSIRCIK